MNVAQVCKHTTATDGCGMSVRSNHLSRKIHIASIAKHYQNKRPHMKDRRRSKNAQTLRVIGPFFCVVMALVFLTSSSICVMTSLRAYIAGESVWSKCEKDALFYLSQYAQSGNYLFYERYRAATIALNALGEARLMLEQDPPNDTAGRRLLVQSGVDQRDVKGAMTIFHLFRHLGLIDPALTYWAQGDAQLRVLITVGDALHAQVVSGRLTPQAAEAFQKSIRDIDDSINPLSRGFGEVFGDVFRKTAALLLFANMIAAICLLILAAMYVRRLIGQRAHIATALERSEARARATLSAIGEAVIATDHRGTIEFVNRAAETIAGKPARDCMGQKFSSVFNLTHEITDRSVDPTITANRGKLTNRIHQARLQRCDGRQYFFNAVTARIDHVAGNAPYDEGIVVVLHDVTQERKHTEMLAWRAAHDTLTQLINRDEFEKRLSDALVKIGSGTQTKFCALLCLDLDRFKVINDTCGHAAGDQMLREISALLQRCLNDGDTVARLGGDEFGVLLYGSNRAELEGLAQNIRNRVVHFAFRYSAQIFTVSVSIGLLHLNVPALTTDEAMRIADIACYVAKSRGRDRIQVADLSDDEMALQANAGAWGLRLINAIQHGNFRIFAQPIVHISRNVNWRDTPTRVELLLRMVDPKSGDTVLPRDFIPLAEQYGLMQSLDHWVVKTALAALSLPENRQYLEYSINLSADSVTDDLFLAFLKSEFLSSQVPYSLICFEITEAIAGKNLASATVFMRELAALGCRFSFGDFGAGLSSLAYLKVLPIHYIKIDASFVKDMDVDNVSNDMVIAINDMGHALNCKTIATHVESERILRLLEAVGVDYAQGFYVGYPTPWTECHVA